MVPEELTSSRLVTYITRKQRALLTQPLTAADIAVAEGNRSGSPSMSMHYT